MKTKKILTLVLAMVMIMSLALTGCGGGGGEEPADEGYKVGVIAPLTGSVSVYGIAVKNAAEMAKEEINAAGGIDGKMVELVIMDDKGDSTEGVSAFNKLVSDGITVVLGPVTSGVTSAVTSIANSEGVVMLTPTSTADTITTESDYVFRSCFKDSYQGIMGAKFLSENGYTKAAVLYCAGDTYSKGLRDSFVAAAPDFGIEVVVDEASSSMDDTDFTTQATKIAAAGADSLFAAYYYNAAGPYIIPQTRAAGFTGAVMGPDGFDGIVPDYITGTMADYNNVFFTNHYSTEDEKEIVQSFIANYQAAYGEMPNALAALGYDGANMLFKAITEAGTTEAAAVKAALDGMEFDGVTGTFVLDETGTPEKSVAIIELYEDGDSVSQKFNKTQN
ncbi:MAG: ABC transporter substrate-binding protein [Eubacteriales bacterium]|nr:ABC transporter substrate-binding protein [Eubacteriales bacterium]MDD4285874.1 ABC transporter substrate-binding protein [Eubacteriales bacterium]NLV69631.1 ABC transporter substrate-binding protein [Clostridiales bacterium]HPF19090.1 ABC transporter substrate-binding protein [Bacillota bacterium]